MAKKKPVKKVKPGKTTTQDAEGPSNPPPNPPGSGH
jgi:hypothetical protein